MIYFLLIAQLWVLAVAIESFAKDICLSFPDEWYGEEIFVKQLVRNYRKLIMPFSYVASSKKQGNALVIQLVGEAWMNK